MANKASHVDAAEIECIALFNSIADCQFPALNRPSFYAWRSARISDPKQAALSDIIDRGILPAIKVMLRVDSVLLPSVLRDAHLIAQLLIDKPYLIGLARENRERRKLKQQIEAFSKELITEKVGYILNEKEYERYLALFSYTKNDDDQFPVWVAGMLIDMHNWIFSCFVDGHSLSKLDQDFNGAISNVYLQLGDLLLFEQREEIFRKKNLEDSTQAGRNSKRKSKMPTLIKDLESILNEEIKIGSKFKFDEIIGKLKRIYPIDHDNYYEICEDSIENMEGFMLIKSLKSRVSDIRNRLMK
ncbi:hypothetical protein [Shewanella algidipiscicola]|uniref:hypothetical protein n=1 Tax=Shewanella algidipiscicola TaxID=614070 RepID=UPI000D782562|nr:hypothetical protein [Shewanella algidipiscicola]